MMKRQYVYSWYSADKGEGSMTPPDKNDDWRIVNMPSIIEGYNKQFPFFVIWECWAEEK